MFYVFQIIVLFETLLFGSGLVEIGTSDFLPEGCGFSRQSAKVDTDCFQWHRDGVLIENDKIITASDAPWLALLQTYDMFNEEANKTQSILCSGAVIANQWILTAAHCVKGSNDIEIYVGFNAKINDGNDAKYKSNSISLHPKFNDKDEYDLALVKMDKPINTEENNIVYNENNICLPEKMGDQDVTRQYVMVPSWNGANGLAKIGYWTMEYKRDPNNPTYSLITNADHATCEADKGGPVWQYSMGRAVVIGMLPTFQKVAWVEGGQPFECHNSTEQTHKMHWVDSEIDWIKSVIMV